MATASSVAVPKRKKLVYGKLSKSTFSGANFFDDDEDELGRPQTLTTRQQNVKESYSVQKTEVKDNAPKSAEQRAKRNDTFDVPSSDDESIAEQRVVPLLKYRPSLVDDSKRRHLAPWERASNEDSAHYTKRSTATRQRTAPGSPEAQLKRELARATQSPEARPSLDSTPRSISPVRQRSSPALSPSESKTVGHEVSAAARLAARKRLAERSAVSSADERLQNGKGASKRSIRTTPETTPRKRARTGEDTLGSNVDIEMTGASQTPRKASPSKSQSVLDELPDVYDFPDGGEEEPMAAKCRSKSGELNVRRGKLNAHPKMTPRKGGSAPTRLTEMLSTDTDTTDAPTRSPSASTSRKSTPQQPSTPPEAIGSPQTAVQAAGTVTPKQANLWNRLLPGSTVVPSPSVLPIKQLTIADVMPSGNTSFARRLSKSNISRRRTRLVDRLKASAVNSEVESSDEEESDGVIEDIEMTNSTPATQKPSTKDRPPLLRYGSQSQSNLETATGKTGPKVTYSRVRSYLPEDSLEADLMLGLDAETLHTSKPRKQGNSHNSQKSAYDLESSDDEDGAGKIRSVHELRASGSNVRGMGDIDDILDDITKHTLSQRGTRRTALVDLGARLMENTFKDRFISQSCETRLVAECGAASDEVADFLLICNLAVLLDSSPPQHVIQSFREGQVLVWLLQHLESSTPILRIAKERRNNMSKSSLSSFTDFTNKVESHSGLWGDTAPFVMTFRIIALKAVDLLARGLRRMGDQDELLSSEQIQAILGNDHSRSGEDPQLDRALSISVLESLSTTTTALEWPTDVLERIARILPSLHNALASLRHTRFLTLRLCLNLTNDNERNCSLIAESNGGSTVPCLLQAIQTGFADLGREEDAKSKAVTLDLLVLALGIMINLGEHSDEARQHALNDALGLESLIGVFQYAQKHMLEAESEEESVANVTFGYLAVVLANLCQHGATRGFIASKLPGQNLRLLVVAVEEFVAHHQKVDTLNFEGEEGLEVWSGFTEKLKAVLTRLKEVESL